MEHNGNSVQWPQGMNKQLADELIIEFFSPMIAISPHNEVEDDSMSVPQVSVSNVSPDDSDLQINQVERGNLRDLLELSEVGETVVCPDGWSALRARQSFG